MRRGEIFMIAFILLLFGSMAYAIISTAAAHEGVPPNPEPWSPPEIQQCDLELWDRIRYLCPQEGDEE